MEFITDIPSQFYEIIKEIWAQIAYYTSNIYKNTHEEKKFKINWSDLLFSNECKDSHDIEYASIFFLGFWTYLF